MRKKNTVIIIIIIIIIIISHPHQDPLHRPVVIHLLTDVQESYVAVFS